MKRYVEEFANDVVKSMSLAPPTIRESIKSDIERTVKYCELGLISDFEAVEYIIILIRRRGDGIPE